MEIKLDQEALHTLVAHLCNRKGKSVVLHTDESLVACLPEGGHFSIRLDTYFINEDHTKVLPPYEGKLHNARLFADLVIKTNGATYKYIDVAGPHAVLGRILATLKESGAILLPIGDPEDPFSTWDTTLLVEDEE